MTSTSESGIEKKISDYFENASYDELYSNDIWFTIIIILIVVIIVIYFYIKSTLVAYRNSWQDHKCNPLLMPFASIINSDKVYNNDLEYIANNFTECLNILNEEVAVDTDKPLKSILKYINNFFNILYTAFIGIKTFILFLFTLLVYFLKLLNNSLQNILLQLRLFFMNINDFLKKIVSAFVVIYYTLMLLIRSWKLMFAVLAMGWLLTVVVPVSMIMLASLILLIITVIIMLFASSIPFIGPIIAVFLIILIIFYGGTFLVSLVVFTLTMFIYIIFGEFLAEIA